MSDIKNITFVYDGIIVTTTVDNFMIAEYKEHVSNCSDLTDNDIAVNIAISLIAEYGLDNRLSQEIHINDEIYES